MANRKNDFESPIPLTDGGTGATSASGARTNLGITIGNRTIVGTTEQVDVANGNGLLGNPTISMASNPVIPGSNAMTSPRGTSSEYPTTPVEGMVRGNTDTGFTEVYSDGVWRPLGRTIVGTPNEIDVANGDGFLGDPTLSISDDPILPGTGAATMPLGTTAERHPTPVNGMVRGNTDTSFLEIYSNGAWRPQGRVMQGTANEITITNGDGVSGDPTFRLANNLVAPGNGSVTIPTGTTAQRPGSPVLGMVRANTDSNQIEVYSGGTWSALNFYFNVITGLVNTVASVTSMSFSAGQAADSTNSKLIYSLTPFTKTINAVWTQGTGLGGRASAVALTANTLYYTFLIVKDNGVVDFGFDTSVTAENLMSDAAGSGFTLYRRVGSCRTKVGSTDLETIYHINDYFYYENPRKDYVAALGAAGTTNTTVPLSVPTGIPISINLIASARRFSSGSSTTRIYAMPVTNPGIADDYLSHTFQPTNGNNNAAGRLFYDIPSTNGSVRLYSVLDGPADGESRIVTLGWTDTRGR